MNNYVEISNLHFRQQHRVIFKGVDLFIPKGKITTIMGPSGAGKTTLLRIIGGQIKPSLGEVLVNNQNVHRLKQAELYKLRKKIGMLFQVGGLFTHLNVFENVAFPLREHTKLNEDMIRSLVLMKLEMVGLRGAQKLKPNELSGGMARRVALARAIALDPELILYDEPFTGQDPISMGVLVKLIKSLNEVLGLTSIIVSHDVPETLSISDYVYVIAAGKIIGHGSPKEIKKRDSKQLEQFLCGLPDGPVPFHYPTMKIEKELLKVN